MKVRYPMHPSCAVTEACHTPCGTSHMLRTSQIDTPPHGTSDCLMFLSMDRQGWGKSKWDRGSICVNWQQDGGVEGQRSGLVCGPPPHPTPAQRDTYHFPRCSWDPREAPKPNGTL